MRAELGATLLDTQAQLRKMQEDVGKANKIVIVGGGPAGLEYAGVSILSLPVLRV